MSMTNDVEVPTIKGAAKDYWSRVKAGDIGSLPAILGLVVLCLVFGSMSSVFLTPGNFANLITQAAAVIVIAMGLIFVLLLGEIDLSAGYTAGVTGAVLVILITNQGQPWYVALVASIAVGALLGFLLGSLVARLGIPSFVVTLAAFLAFQGILLISLLLVSLDRTTKLNEFQAISYEFINKLQARELIRHHSAIVVADVLRVCVYKKRKRVLIERTKKLQVTVTAEAKAQMDRQIEELEDKIKTTMNKITREKILLMKLRQSLVQEFEWPVEDLLRQLKSEMEKDIKEISGQIAHMRDTKNLLSNVQSY